MVLGQCIAFDVVFPGDVTYSTFCSPFGIFLATFQCMIGTSLQQWLICCINYIFTNVSRYSKCYSHSPTTTIYIVATTIRTTCMDNSKTTTKITTTPFDLLYNQIILYMITSFLSNRYQSCFLERKNSTYFLFSS